MNWIKFDRIYVDELKRGTICKTDDDSFFLVGDINVSLGLNDEFTQNVTHYTEDFVSVIEQLISTAEKDFNSNKY